MNSVIRVCFNESLCPLMTSCTKYPIESNALWEVHCIVSSLQGNECYMNLHWCVCCRSRPVTIRFTGNVNILGAKFLSIFKTNNFTDTFHSFTNMIKLEIVGSLHVQKLFCYRILFNHFLWNKIRGKKMVLNLQHFFSIVQNKSWETQKIRK